jgi:Flp pilus assembly pilin Flp
MEKFLRRFWNDELGSAVVDWMVLGAGIVSLSVAVATTLA